MVCSVFGDCKSQDNAQSFMRLVLQETGARRGPVLIGVDWNAAVEQRDHEIVAPSSDTCFAAGLVG